MSFYDYKASQRLSLNDPPFYALVMTAMRKADSQNLALLRGCWPDVYEELQMRYNAPGGVLAGEVVS